MKRFGDTARLALLLASVSAAPFALATPALAQDGAEADDEIVVTARRTEENLQDVPASVSAFSEEQMERLGATDATGLQGAVPNLNVVQGRGSSNATNIYIRGVGQPDALQTFDPAVGFYVDGVYYSRIRGTQMELFDLERVEVLRGPQGTLYGKNTIGGAYSVVTRSPGQTPRGLAQVTIGDYGQLETRLAASGPLTDTFAIGGAVFGATREDYVENPVTGEDYNDRNAWGGRFQAAWEVTPSLTLDFAADYSEEDNALTMGQPTTSLINFGGITYYNIPGTSFPTAAEPPEYDFTAQATPGLPNSSVMDHGGVSLRASWELNDNWTINSITAARDLNYTDYIDIDATEIEFGDVLVDVDQDQFSQELQAIYESDRFTFVSGLFYLRENVASHQEAYADDLVTGFFGLGPGFLRTIDDDLTTTSMAIYGNLAWALTDRLNLGLGLRYSEEEKEYDRTTSTFYATNPFFNATFPFSRSETWDNTTPMVSLDYELTDNVLLYARYAEGFKSGGFNGRANNDGEDAPYDPETVSSFEVGAKTDWLDGRLVANVSAFYNDYTDFQARVSGTVIDPDTMLPTPELTVINAGQLEISGAELELRYRATDALTLDAQIGYLDAQYGEFDDARFPGGSRTFQTPAFSPEWTARFGGLYSIDLGSHGDLDLAASARFRSRMALAIDNTFVVGGAIGTTTEVPGLWQDDYWLYDASVTWRPTDVFSVALVGRNLGDEIYKTDAQEFSSIGEIRTAYYGAPRTVSLVLTARY